MVSEQYTWGETGNTYTASIEETGSWTANYNYETANFEGTIQGDSVVSWTRDERESHCSYSMTMTAVKK